MHAKEKKLAAFLRHNERRYIIPVFQRDYAWTAKEDCFQLWSDIERIASATENRPHFLGSIVHKNIDSGYSDFRRHLIIDGQQRMTTLTLLLLAMRDNLRKTRRSPHNVPSADELNEYLQNRHKSGPDKYPITLRDRDQNTLSALIDGDDLHGESLRVRANYEWFLSKIESADLELVWQGINLLFIVDVGLDPEDDAQAIYESLNSTGMALLSTDLIRNRILMGLPLEEQTDLYNRYWKEMEDLFHGEEDVFEDFARDYLDLKNGNQEPTTKTRVYSEFRKFWRDHLENYALKEALRVMLRHARHYAAFRLGKENNKERRKRYLRIKERSDTAAVTGMRLLECREQAGEAGEQDFLAALDLIESFLVRRAVCGLPTNSYPKMFAALAFWIRDTQPLTDIKVAFQLQPMGYTFPSDGDFNAELKENDFYGEKRSKPICKPLLERFENHDTKEPSSTSGCEIEHVMPKGENLREEWRDMLGEDWKNVHETWKHRLGNLTLTAYNQPLSDKSFAEKKKIFSKSGLRLNSFIREQARWTAAEMEKRTDEFAGKALEIWAPLKVDRASVDEGILRKRQKKAGSRTPQDVSMSDPVRHLFEELRSHILQIGQDIVEIAEERSVSYHRTRYFLEIVPRKHDLHLLLAVKLDEAEDFPGEKESLRSRDWVPNAQYFSESDVGLTVDSDNLETLEAAILVIQRAYRGVP